MKVAVVKYNAGNIRSVDYALKRLGVEAVITADEAVLRAADKVIFPGVGEAETTMSFLRAGGMDRLIKELRQPVLGICRGIQFLNVYLGGTLYQDVHACGLTDAAHQQKPPYDVVRQRVDIAPGSVLDRVLCDGAGEGMVPGCKAGWPASLETSWEGIAPAPHSLLVNTMHHQAIACVADPLQVSAVSGDGLVEGLEDPSRRFYLGVQWHPEYLDDNVPLFEALVAAAK